MRGLAILLASCAALVCAAPARAQFLKDPELLAQYEQLAMAGSHAETAEADLKEFAADYLQTASLDDRCLFGCSSGFSGDAPDYEGPGFREFLARSDIASLAVELQMPDAALDHLSRSARLLSDQWKLQSILRTSGEPSDRIMDVFLRHGWMFNQGCSGSPQDPAELAVVLLAKTDMLEQQVSLMPDQKRKLASIETQLREIRPFGE